MTRAVSTSHAVSVDDSRAGTFDDLIAPHLEAGYQTALAILHDHEEARDAMQESAVRAWRKLGQLKDGRAAGHGFLRSSRTSAGRCGGHGGGRCSAFGTWNLNG